MIIKSARFVSPHSRRSVIIEMRVDHPGAAGKAFVSCRANTESYELREFAGVVDGPVGDALIAYIKAAASRGGKVRAAIEHARGQGW